MRFEIDTSMHWTDHYVEHGFAVIKDLVDRAWIEEAFARVRQKIGTDLPPNEWNTQTVDCDSSGRIMMDASAVEYLDTVYDDPGLRSMIDTMFGNPAEWSGERLTRAFVSVYNPEAKQEIDPIGHIDFVRTRAPMLGSGFMFFVSLVKTEPFSGNLTLYPGTHKPIQKKMLDDPDWVYSGADSLRFIERVPPYEFVADPGDVVLFHHLVCHAGNLNHATGRSPRVCVHAQALRNEWGRDIDPAAGPLSPWERSLTVNGPVHLAYDEKAMFVQS